MQVFSIPCRACAKAAYFVLCKPRRLCYTRPAANPWFAPFLGSSAVEHSTVNRMVAGSNPARGAIGLFRRRAQASADALQNSLEPMNPRAKLACVTAAILPPLAVKRRVQRALAREMEWPPRTCIFLNTICNTISYIGLVMWKIGRPIAPSASIEPKRAAPTLRIASHKGIESG